MGGENTMSYVKSELSQNNKFVNNAYQGICLM